MKPRREKRRDFVSPMNRRMQGSALMVGFLGIGWNAHSAGNPRETQIPPARNRSDALRSFAPIRACQKNKAPAE